MPANLDAYAAQFFREQRRVGADSRADRLKPRPVSEGLLDELLVDPEAAWPRLLAILERARTPDQLEAAAVGPLETLLIQWGPRFADRLAAERSRSPKLDQALEALPASFWTVIDPSVGRVLASRRSRDIQ